MGRKKKYINIFGSFTEPFRFFSCRDCDLSNKQIFTSDGNNETFDCIIELDVVIQTIIKRGDLWLDHSFDTSLFSIMLFCVITC